MEILIERWPLGVILAGIRKHPRGEVSSKMKQLSAEEQKKALAEYMYLSFFNRTLRDKGLITQKEYQELQTQFLTRKPLPKKQSFQSYEMEM